MIADGTALEQAVLGHALNSPECFQQFALQLSWEKFSAPTHRVLAYCLKRMADLGMASADEDSLNLVVNSYPGEDPVDYGGIDYVRELRSSFAEPTENYSHFVSQMRLFGAKTTLARKHLQDINALTNNPNATPQELRAALHEALLEVDEASVDGFNFLDMARLSNDYADELDKRANAPFHTTGLPSLDEELTEGFAPKAITVMAGFTGMAKSTVAITMAHRIAVAGTGTAMFSMESTRFSLFDKMMATLTQIPIGRLKKESAALSSDERMRIDRAMESLYELPLLIDDTASLSIDGMLYQLRTAQRKGHDPKVVFVDLFGKIEDVDTGENLATRIQRECKRMRVLAKELDVHFVLVVQVGRQGFGRGRGGAIRRPTLIDIKNANAYAEEADVVLLLHRNKYYEQDLDDDILEVDVAKQRDGVANTKVYFEFFPDTGTIMSTDKLPHDVVRD